MGALRVLIVDDEEDIRALLRSLIEVADGDLSVAGEAVDGDDALRQWRQRRPELVLLDQRMPGLSGPGNNSESPGRRAALSDARAATREAPSTPSALSDVASLRVSDQCDPGRSERPTTVKTALP